MDSDRSLVGCNGGISVLCREREAITLCDSVKATTLP